MKLDPQSRMPVRQRALVAVASLTGVLVLVSCWFVSARKIIRGYNDFLFVYVGAVMAGSPELYDREQRRQVAIECCGLMSDQAVQHYPRLPFYAVLTRPLAALPYRTAYWIWQGLSVAALVGLVLLYPGEKWHAALAVCWSYPASYAIANGQDASFLALGVVLALSLYRRSLFWAGMALSIALVKYHLFVLLPLVFIARRRWKAASGLATGAGVLMGISLLVGGPGWVGRYLKVLTDDTINPAVQMMPNLHGLFARVPAGFYWEVLASVAVTGMVWFICRKCNFELGLAAALIGGLLVSYHAYPTDFLLAVPALLLIQRASSPRLRLLCIFMLHPAAYALYPQVGFVAVLAWYAYHVRRSRLTGLPDRANVADAIGGEGVTYASP